MKEYPEKYSVQTIDCSSVQHASVTMRVPGSKSMTNRALLLATLAEGKSTLNGVLFSDDSRHFMQCVQELGYKTEIDEKLCRAVIYGCGARIPKKNAGIYVGSAGTAARFLTALVGISDGHYELDASEQMRRRPMAPLLNSLRELGTEIVCTQNEGYFPFILESKGIKKHEITINIDDSSQFLSALLIACCITGKDFTIHVKGSHGMAYIDMTTKMMQEFGVASKRTEKNGEITYLVDGDQSYLPRDYRIEPDLSGACYFYAAAMLLGIEVTVEHVHKDTLQGDIALLYLFCKMGATMRETEAGIALKGPENGRFHGVEADMHAFSDQALTLAALAPFADSPTTINGISHIRGQECDRIAAIVNELRRLGVTCEELEDGVKIYPAGDGIKAGTIQTYDDHRVAMSFSLIGLRVPGIIIDNPGCCRKTFENYFDVLETMCESLRK